MSNMPWYDDVEKIKNHYYHSEKSWRRGFWCGISASVAVAVVMTLIFH